MTDSAVKLGERGLEVVVLGTGAAAPSRYRGCSAVYVNLFERGGILVDCGEGALGQLRRRYGRRRTEDVVSGLVAVWISHMHADHHLGLPHILALHNRIQTRHRPV